MPLRQNGTPYWFDVPARQEVLSLTRGGTAQRSVTMTARSLVDQTDRTIATIDDLSQQLAVSPDGRRIVYATFLNNTNRCDVSLMAIDGTREKVLVPGLRPCASPVAWSPNGRYVLLTSHSSGSQTNPRVVDVETGWFGGSWSPDGSFVVLHHTATRRDRLAWDGVTYEAVTRLMNAKRQARSSHRRGREGGPSRPPSRSHFFTTARFSSAHNSDLFSPIVNATRRPSGLKENQPRTRLTS